MNKKQKAQAGNTLTMVIVCLVIVSIMALASIYAVSYLSTARSKAANKNYDDLILENLAYEVINLKLENNSFGEEDLKNAFLDKFKDANVELVILELDNNNLNFKIRYQDATSGLFVKVVLDSYTIKGWGTASWTS